MAGIADLPAAGGAIPDLPQILPGTNEVTPRDAAQTDSSVTRGLRMGFNQLGNAAEALAGSVGETLGLTDFAAKRFAEADQYTQMADAVGPRVRDISAVKDFDDLADYVGGMVGQGLGSSAPALAGAAMAGGGLRGRMLGLAAGSFIPNAGQQANDLRTSPGTPGEKLANALGVGAINTGLDLATGAEGQVVRNLARPTLAGGAKAVAKSIGKAALGEGATEGLQEVVSEGGGMLLDPSKKLDPNAILNNVVGGAVGGAALGAGGHALGAAPGAISDTVDAFKGFKDKFGRQESVVDDNDPAELQKIAEDPAHQTPEDMLAAIDGLGERANSSLRDAAAKGKDFFDKHLGDFSVDDALAEGGEKLDKLKSVAKDWVNATRDRPEVQAALKQARDAKDFVKGFYDAATGKKSLQRTGVDLALHDAVLKMLPDTTRANLSPSELMELSGMVKHAALHASGARTEVEGPQAGSRALNGPFPTGTVTEGDRTTQPVRLPSGMLKLLGPDAVGIIQAAQDVLKSGGIPFKGQAQAAVDESAGRVRDRRSKIEQIIHANMKDEFAVDKAKRDYVAENFMRMLSNTDVTPEDMRNTEAAGERARTPAGSRIMEAAGHIFDDRAKAMNAIQDAIDNHGLAGEFHLSPDEAEQFGKDKRTSDDEGKPTQEEETGLDKDPRLNTKYKTVEEARQALRGLESDYPANKVQFRAEHVTKFDPESGMPQPTGEIALRATDRESSTGFTGEPPHLREDGSVSQGSGQWRAIADNNASRKAGFEHGTITAKLTDGKTVRVSLRALTAEAVRTYDRNGEGRRPYPHDVVLHGLAQLLSDERVSSVAEKKGGKELGAEQWDIPDNTPVGKIGGVPYVWGQIKQMTKMSQRELNMRMLRENTVEMAEQATDLDEIRKDIWPDLKRRVDEFSERFDEAQATADKLKKRGATGALMENAVKARDFAKRDLDSILAVQTKVIEEAERRKEEGDFPKMELGSLNIDEGMAEKSQTGGTAGTLRGEDEGKGQRNVQEETGASLHGNDRPKGAGYAPHEMGVNESARAPAPVTTVELEATDEEKERIKDARKARDAQAMAEDPSIRERMKAEDAEVMRGEKFSLMENQKSGLVERADKLSPKEWLAFMSTVENSTNATSIADTKAFLDSLNLDRDFPSVENYERVERRLDDLHELLERREGELGEKKTSIPAAGAALTDAQKAEVRAYVEKVLGKDKTRVAFKNMAEAGSFRIDPTGVEQLRIANLALDPLGAARHEAAHAFMGRLMDADKRSAQQVMAAAGSASVISRLRVLLKDHPEALKQLSDPEERAAYMYQFWAAGQLDVGPNTKGVLASISKYFKALAGIWSESFTDAHNVDRAHQIFSLFDKGELSDRNTVAEVLRAKAPRVPFARAADAVGPMWEGVKRALYTSDGFVRSMNIPSFNKVADLFFAPQGRAEIEPGFNQSKHPARNRYMSQVTDALRGLDEVGQRQLLEHLQAGTKPTTPQQQAALAKVQRMLGDVFAYMKDAGVKAVVWNGKEYEEHEINAVPDYFPRYYDQNYMAEHREQFIAMLRRNGLSEGEAGSVADNITRSGPADPAENDELVGLTYFAPNTQSRKLDVPAAELAPFLRKDLYGTLNSYVSYTVRRAEYTRRFGNQGQDIRTAIADAVKNEGATEDQVRDFNRAVQAWEGSLGHDIKPGLKGMFGAITTYQNIRLLPLAIFSSLIDPQGIMVRGGTVMEAGSAFLRGVRGLVSESKDDAYHMAIAAGTIADSVDDHMLADAYGSQYMPDALRHINDKFFRWNGMESWNRQMRVAATAAAVNFLIRHATSPNEHSARYLAELNLKAADIAPKNGTLDMTNQKIRDAVNQWVDGAVLRPNASIRPVWMSDPHWMLVSHLKQYTYSFQKTIIARVAHEAAHGNYTPALALASYVPMIIAADVLRAALTPGQGDDDAIKRLTMSGVIGRGIQRAGLVGPGQYALDAYGDLGHDRIPFASFGGPTFQQLVELGGSVASPKGDLNHELLRATPGYVFFK